MSVKSDEAVDLKGIANWEERQKHASFSQKTLNSMQQNAISLFIAASLLITLGIALVKLSGMKDGHDWYVMLAGVIGWLFVIWMITSNFRTMAERINAAYLDEHRQLFPSSRPYRLESFLLTRPRKRSRFWQKRDSDQTDAAIH